MAMDMEIHGYGDVHIVHTPQPAGHARLTGRSRHGATHGSWDIVYGDMNTSTYGCVLSMALILCPLGTQDSLGFWLKA